jgi:ABC-type antimicrobial peptide transport system permease subunit
VYISPRYFETMEIPIVAGRAIGTDDRAGAPPVVVINQTAARVLFGGDDPIGRTISGTDRFDAKESRQIVGVARDVHFSNARDPFDFVLYVPIQQQPNPVTSIVVRANSPVPARATIQEVAPDLKIGAIRTFDEAFEAGLGRDKLLAVLAAAFGFLALALSYVGVYGVLSYAVERRTHEIGIRLALGAGRTTVYGMVLCQTAVLVGASIVVGGAGSLAVTRALRSTLFGFAPADYLLPALASALLCGVALAAAWFPARRAAGLDPVVALRED